MAVWHCRALGSWLAALALVAHAAPALAACDGAERIRLRAPVPLSEQERALLRNLPPLRIYAVNAPPMTRYDPQRATYTGISPDVLQAFKSTGPGWQTRIHALLRQAVERGLEKT